MKKKLESELISIAHRILKLTGKEDIHKMHAEVAQLYEKLTVLKFAQDNFEEEIPSINSDASFFNMLDQAFNNKVSDNIEIEDKVYINLDDSEHEAIMEPAIEKIKNMVQHMPNEEDAVADFLKNLIPKEETVKNDFEEITADFKETPVFEPKTKNTEKISLNDKLKTGDLQIGLNDKLAFIKHLFAGNNEDYERVLSQINTLNSFAEAKDVIENLIKPEYQNWKDKEDFELRFMEIIEAKFN